MGINYETLAVLMRSRYRDDGAYVIKEIGRKNGIEDPVANAVVNAMLYTGDHERAPWAATEQVLEDSFSMFELLRSGRPDGRARFVEYVNTISRLSAMADMALRSGKKLLEAPDGEGKDLISSPAVRNHIEMVVSLIEWMGPGHLVDPENWSELVGAAFKDLCLMDRLANETGPKQILAELSKFIMGLRASGEIGTGEFLSMASFNVNEAYEAGDGKQLLAQTLDVWLKAVEHIDVYKGYSSRMEEEVSKGRISAVSPERVDCFDSGAGILTGGCCEESGCDDGAAIDDLAICSEVAVDGADIALSGVIYACFPFAACMPVA